MAAVHGAPATHQATLHGRRAPLCREKASPVSCPVLFTAPRMEGLPGSPPFSVIYVCV